MNKRLARAGLIVFLVSLHPGLRAVLAEDYTDKNQLPLNQNSPPQQQSAATSIAGPGQKIRNTPAPELPAIMQIKRLETEEPLYSFELRDVEIGDLFRVLAHDYRLNLIIDKDAQGKITASLSRVSLEEALETIAESQNIALEKKGNVIKVIPNLVTKVFILNYVEARSLLEPSSNSSSSASPQGTGQVSGSYPPSSSQAGQPQATGTPPSSDSMPPTSAEQPSATGSSSSSSERKENTIYDLLSDKGKILSGKQPNSIMVIDYSSNVRKIEEYLDAIDKKLTSRVFKLKYLKAAEVVGNPSASSSTATTATGTTTATSANGTSSGSSTSSNTSGSTY